ncbi:MAG: flavin reductase family protein [Proteobacteria bacterium]|nr:flavin reductase family protein [Pseudomonadota bacterium]MDA0994758.1 flavin reductase family protein [Pseudomonadota bacterium]
MNDVQALRQCLGKFATGVTVVTCADANGNPNGITANSFSAVSLEPPLVLWNIAKVSNSLDAYLSAKYFAVNVLTADQRNLAAHFAKSDHTRFDNVEYTTSANGVPLLPDTLATFNCRTHEIHDCGDHYVIIGEVNSFKSAEREPLLFFGSAYRAIAK